MTLVTACVLFAGAVFGGLFWYPFGHMRGRHAEKEKQLIKQNKAGEK